MQTFAQRCAHGRRFQRSVLSISVAPFCGGPDAMADRSLNVFDRLYKRKQVLTPRFCASAAAEEEEDRLRLHSFASCCLKQRDRAAWLMGPEDPLLDAVTDNLLDRLQDCKRSFPSALNLGGAIEKVRRWHKGRGGIETMITMDISYDMVKKSMEAALEEMTAENQNMENFFLVGDEEFLPFKEGSFDVIISSLGLHWVNDLPGAMNQCRMALKPDGLFLAAILGGETLRELRIACTVAQLEREGGISPRVSPLVRVQDAGNLLTRSGLALPTVDVDKYTVKYPNALELVEHLRIMGEGNAVLERNQSLRRETALATAAIYEAMFGEEDGSIPATFQVIYMAGWRPHPLQQKAKRRGSATVSFEEIQNVFGGSDASEVKK